MTVRHSRSGLPRSVLADAWGWKCGRASGAPLPNEVGGRGLPPRGSGRLVGTRKEASHDRNRPFHRQRPRRRHIRPQPTRFQSGHRRYGKDRRARLARGSRPRRRRGSRSLADMGEDAVAAPGPNPRPVQDHPLGAGRPAGRSDLGRARQDPRRRQGRGDPRPRGGRVRGRCAAPSEGRDHRERRHRRRQPLAAPAAGRGRGHHAVQLPRHGADVDVPGRPRLRQLLYSQAVRARPLSRHC